MTSEQEVAELLRRCQAAESAQLQWNILLDEAYQYSMPNRNVFDGCETPAAKKNVDVYDLTAVLATKKFVSNIENALNPPNSNWIMLEPSENMPKEYKNEVKENLQKLTDILMFYINHSNYYLASYGAAYDLAAGTAALLVLEGDDKRPFNFQVVPINKIALEQNSYGVIDGVWRNFSTVKVRDIKSLWPNAKINSTLSDIIKNAKPEQDLQFKEGTLPIGTQNEPKFRYVVIHPGSQCVIVDEEMESSHWIVYRWDRLATEIMGRGPLLDALPTIRTVNKMAEFVLRSAAFKALPPFFGFADDVFNPWTARIEPNIIIPINRNSVGMEPLKALELPINIQYPELVMNEFRQQISDIFFVNPIGEMDTPSKTAYEISIRQKIVLQTMGPAFMRLQEEKLTPLVKRCLYILQKRGLMPNFEIDGKFVKATYQSPLVESRKIEDVQNFNNFYRNMQEVYGPQIALTMIKTSQIPAYLADKYNADLDLVSSPEEIQAAANKLQANMSSQQTQLEQPGQVQPPPV